MNGSGLTVSHCLVAFALSAAAAAAVADPVTAVVADAHYPEGPLWRDGKLFYVEYATSNIKYWDGRRTAVYWHKDGCGPSALIPFNGHLLIACYDDNSLVELDANTKEVRTIRADSSGKPFTGPNDFAADARGAVGLDVEVFSPPPGQLPPRMNAAFEVS